MGGTFKLSKVQIPTMSCILPLMGALGHNIDTKYVIS